MKHETPSIVTGTVTIEEWFIKKQAEAFQARAYAEIDPPSNITHK
jgi:hypothetical protein